MEKMKKLSFRGLLKRWDAEQKKVLRRQLFLLVAAALVLTFFLQYRYFINDVGRTWDFVIERPRMFLYNAFIVFLILGFFTALFRGPWAAIGLGAVAIEIVGYIHIAKFGERGTPLLPEDFQLASEVSSLTKFVDWTGIIKLIIAVILTILLAWLVGRLTRNYYGFRREESDAEVTWRKKNNRQARLLIMAIALLFFFVGTDFVRHHNGKRYEELPLLKSEFIAWNQVKNYDNNGFLVGFLYNWNKFTLTAPDGYDKDKIGEIAKEYEEEKAEDEGRTPLSETDYNVIMILEESFYDPSIIREYYNYGDEDVTPNLHKIMEKYPSGRMYSVDYGGGTANIEFEVLTGFSNYWANTVPYTDILPRIGEIPSYARFAKDNGYKTLAIHPFNGGMYKRNIALKNEGIDEFITETEMDFTEKEGGSQYINDQSAYKQTLKALSETDEKQFIALITMQNHTPYDEDIYETLDYRIPEYEAEDWWREWRVANYLQLLHNSDKYLGEFIEELDKLDEKTVVLFFGDHSPGVFDKVNENEDKEVRDLSRLTPYFVYANFELEGAEKNLPTTTPNCLGNTMWNLLGAEKPALGYLLDKVCAETPILTANYWGEAAPFSTTVLSNYELVNYDILGGKKYWMEF